MIISIGDFLWASQYNNINIQKWQTTNNVKKILTNSTVFNNWSIGRSSQQKIFKELSPFTVIWITHRHNFTCRLTEQFPHLWHMQQLYNTHQWQLNIEYLRQTAGVKGAIPVPLGVWWWTKKDKVRPTVWGQYYFASVLWRCWLGQQNCTDLCFCSHKPDTSLHCKTTDIRFSLLFAVPSKERPGWADWVMVYIMKWLKWLKSPTRCTATSLIQINALPLSQTALDTGESLLKQK